MSRLISAASLVLAVGCTTTESTTTTKDYTKDAPVTEPPSCAGQKGCITTLVGTGYHAVGDDDVVGWKSDLEYPQDIAVSPGGALYYIDWNAHRVRSLDFATGITKTVVGSGVLGDVGKGEIPTDAALNHPTGITFDAKGVLWIAAWHNSKVKKIDPVKNVLEEFAGTGGRAFGGDGGPAAKAVFDLPSSLDFDDAGNMYVSDQSNQRIRKIDMATQIVTTVVGSRWVTDTGKKAGAPLKLADGTYGTFACKFGGTGQGHEDALNPWGVDLTPPSPTQVCQFDATQTDKCKKGPDGTPTKLNLPAPDLCGGYDAKDENGPALSAYLAGPKLQFSYPANRLVIRKNKMYIADTYNNRIRMVDLSTGATPTIQTIVGSGTAGFAGDGDDALKAQLSGPTDVDIMADGAILIADKDNHCIRIVKDGKIGTFAGTCGKKGYGGDGAAAEKALLNEPFGIGIGPDGTVYIADTLNDRVRLVTPK